MNDTVMITLERDEMPTLVGALELAAEKYRDFAQTAVETPRISDQFKRQAEACERLRKMLGHVHGY